MRMFRLPSWISESRGCDKVAHGAGDLKMAEAMHPVVDVMPAGKRKRSDSAATSVVLDDEHDAKRRQSETRAHPYPSPSFEADMDGTAEQEESAAVGSDRLREAIESQFSLEILLKHNELRLINQELAKCQVALEQLRRCHLIPYPISQDTPESRIHVSNGTGPAVGQDGGVPQWAAPYGVTDGPYTRHYAKWLIPDPAFDGEQANTPLGLGASRMGKTISEGRATRNSFAEAITPTTKARSQRGSMGQKLQALSSGYPPPKDKVGPCVLRRGDGQMVKLVCIDCNRDNFSSTQGFINHCRIAHRRAFETHEDAAVASGQPIEVDEVGGIVGEERAPSAASHLVHPLNRSTPADKEAYAALLSRIDTSLAMFQQGKLPGFSQIPTSAVSTPSSGLKSMVEKKPSPNFIASSSTPYLSNLMQTKGFGGNLTELVGEAKTPFDLSQASDEEDSDDGEPQSQPSMNLDDTSDLPAARMPARVARSPGPHGRPGSSKGLEGRTPGISPRLPYTAPVINTGSVQRNIPPAPLGLQSRGDVDRDIDILGHMDLSPHTVASNNAPSLVSDDGEYDDGDDAESARSDGEDHDDLAEIIEDGDVDKVVPRSVMRSRSSGDGLGLRKEDKHVAFVSPAKDTNVKERGGK